MTKRQMMFIPELNLGSFVLFYERGNGGISWSIRDYSFEGGVKLYGPHNSSWTADEIHQKAQLSFDAPTVKTDNLPHWRDLTHDFNRRYLGKAAPASQYVVVPPSASAESMSQPAWEMELAHGNQLVKRSYAALLAGAREVSPTSQYDSRGYAADWRQNIFEGLALPEIIADLSRGAGRELDGKLRAAHSSAALAVNTFGTWRTDPSLLRLKNLAGFTGMRFEATCPTGLKGTPPHLDLLLDGQIPVAVESKCTEWMLAAPAKFSDSYDRLQGSHGSSQWFEIIRQLRADPNRYQHLDAAQLVKHALGLMNRYAQRQVQLWYLYWEPRNSHAWVECGRHRSEADDLASQTASSNVRLVPMSYRELWADWDRHQSPQHLARLKIRYDRDV
jgi:hypothetical protein